MLAYLGFGSIEDPALIQVMLQLGPEHLKEGDREWLKNSWKDSSVNKKEQKENMAVEI